MEKGFAGNNINISAQIKVLASFKFNMEPALRSIWAFKICFYVPEWVRGTSKQYQKHQMLRIIDGKWFYK